MGIPVNLQIVSSGKIANYAFGPYQDSEAEIEEIKKQMAEQEWITYKEQVPNSVLLDMMKEADVGLLPTWADTYGYSVLEFQACGCPVITTNVRALPEINSDDRGWIIQLPVNQLNGLQVSSLEEKEFLRAKLQQELEDVVKNILMNPDQIEKKAIKAYDYVSTNHDLLTYMEKIGRIYEEHF